MYICFMDKETKKLVKHLIKNKSKIAIKVRILFYIILRKINTETFLFSLSLSTTLLFGYLVGNLILVTLFSHFVLWVLFSDRFINKPDMKEENEEISKIIKELKKHVNKKKGVK